MQKIRRKYEGNRLFDCHVRGTICSLNEKRPWLNGITPEGEICSTVSFGAMWHYVAHCLVSIVPPLLRGGKGTGFVGSPWTPENPMTRFPVEKGGAEGTKGGGSGRRPLITAMLFLLMNPKASSWNRPAAGSRKLEADCLHLRPQRLLPAHWYLAAFLSYASRTEILRLRLRMTMRAGRQGT